MPEEFFKVDVHILDHEKIVDLSDAAFRVYIGSIAYAVRLMTDGFVARPVARRLHDCDYADPDDDWREHARELVEAKLWESVEDGWWIHNFAIHNRTKAEVEEQRAEWRERQQRHRDRVTRDSHNGVTRDSRVSHGGVTRKEVEVEGEVTPRSNTVVAQARPVASETRAIFDHWKIATGKSRASLEGVTGKKRRQAIVRALQDYPFEDLLDAVYGWKKDPWPERVHHNDVTVLLRDAEHIEKFRDLWRDGPPAVSANGTRAARHRAQVMETHQQLDAWAREVDARAGNGVADDGHQAQRQLPGPGHRG